MKLHSDILTRDDVTTAARKADMILETFGQGGSRSRKNSFTVIASGNSTRNAMSNEFKAATWDQWGVFLGILFDIDPLLHTGKHGYEDAVDYHNKTDDRFSSARRDQIDVKSKHNHKWINAGAYYSECKSDFCTATVRWLTF